ncbi:MAG: polysaccharide pyruvyl transferase family protein [Clostridium sp.]|nr:polysaccharide pyruvyl transferase family protein [Clostridium sp.]
MKRIGLVTYFKSYNYGVWLQAFATQKFLKLNNFDVDIIDYVNQYENSKLKYSYKEGNKMRGYLTSLLKSILFGKIKFYNKGFKKHINEYYKFSNQTYNNVNELSDVNYDILVVGSDQVWNPVISNGLDDVFLLNFGKDSKRISIASSLGSKRLNNRDEKKLVESLDRFDAISVREKFAKDYLSEKLTKEVKVLVDPTFLLSRDIWINELAKKSVFFKTKEKYILTYFVSKDKKEEKCISLVKSYSERYKLPVWAIQFSTYFSKGVDKKILGATIGDFIALILNAEIVITDSFHGTALSINLNSDFVSCVNSENPVRTQNLLEKVGLLNRINMQVEDYEKIDYCSVNKEVIKMRDDSVSWLLNVLS